MQLNNSRENTNKLPTTPQESAGFDFDLWKEEVQMEAIRLPRHVHHWISAGTNDF
ncbi:MAG: hypothetical protein Q7T54_01400 [Candidatus Levybacteria bacterium]|nr:hypothetical protein [Candidatus Levybacteria bacterium]